MTAVWDLGVQRPATLPLSGDASTDLCVVGLGGSGLTAIREAQSRGMSVIGIDADRIAGAAAGRNGGFMLAGIASFHHDAIAAHGRDTAVALYQHTLDEIDRVERDLPGVFSRIGVIRSAQDDAEMADCIAHVEALVADGFPAHEYQGDQGRGLIVPTDGPFHPVKRAALLATQAIDAGARLHTDTRAIHVTSGEVHTDRGVIRAQHILVAIDGTLGLLIPALADRVRATRLQMVATAPSSVRITHPVYARYGYDYWQQLADGRIAIGGGRDKSIDADWTTDTAPTPVVREHLEQVLHSLGVTEPIEYNWAATVSYTDNGLPVVEEVMPGVWAIGGYCGTGNIVGAALGRGVIELLDTGHSAVVADFRAAQ